MCVACIIKTSDAVDDRINGINTRLADQIRGALPGQDDPHARYLEAAVQGVIVACL